jgi:hypothetical protein
MGNTRPKPSRVTASARRNSRPRWTAYSTQEKSASRIAASRPDLLCKSFHAESQSGHFPCSFIHFDMQALWAVPPPVADSEHRCMHFFSHDCCAAVGTDIVARQSKADAQTSFDIYCLRGSCICGPEYRCGSISGNNKIRWNGPRE